MDCPNETFTTDFVAYCVNLCLKRLLADTFQNYSGYQNIETPKDPHIVPLPLFDDGYNPVIDRFGFDDQLWWLFVADSVPDSSHSRCTQLDSRVTAAHWPLSRLYLHKHSAEYPSFDHSCLIATYRDSGTSIFEHQPGPTMMASSSLTTTSGGGLCLFGILLLLVDHRDAHAQVISYGMRKVALSMNQFGLDMMRTLDRMDRVLNSS